jgi:hypothetical protein
MSVSDYELVMVGCRASAINSDLVAWIVRKSLFSVEWREKPGEGRDAFSDMLQHVNEAIVGADVAQPPGRQQTLHDAKLLGPRRPRAHISLN